MYALKGTSPDNFTGHFHNTFRENVIYILLHYLKAYKKKTSQITYEANKTLVQNLDKDRKCVRAHTRTHTHTPKTRELTKNNVKTINKILTNRI